MSLVLDSGALLALERGKREMWVRLKRAQQAGNPLLTHGGVIGQVWRGNGPRQTLLAVALAGIEARPLDDELGRAAGELLARTRQDDVIDAALALLCEDGDVVVTSDPGDLEPLVAAAGIHVEIISP